MPDHPILVGLNAAQRDAVAATDGNLLVLAGAGSGKTRVLVHRIAWLVEHFGVSPFGILAVTFTNKAAAEMRSRLEGMLGQSTRGMWIGTFHGISHRLLRLHWENAGLPQNFQILDSDDQLRIVKRVTRDMNLDEDKWSPRQTQWWINAHKDEGRRAADIEDHGEHTQSTLLSIYRQYEAACARGGLVDFAELLLRSWELWLRDEQLLQHYRSRFGHLLVDEFQDTNAIQYRWLRALAGPGARVTAVGDDDQSIYGWRGAKIENIHQFQCDFKDVHLVRLEQNYRSTGNILNAANAVIEQNLDRLGKQLWTSSGEGEPVTLYAAFNEQDEARYIVDELQKWIAGGEARADAAILYRSNAQSRVLEEALLRAGIPYRVYGGLRFYERLEIKNALAYLRLMQNRGDDAAFERVVNTPPRGIGTATVDSVRARARVMGVSLWEAAKAVAGELPARARNALLGFVDLLNQLQRDLDGLELAERVDRMLAATGLVEFHRNEKGERGETRVENLEELVTACRVFVPEDPERDELEQFLDTASLDAGETQAEESEDSVQLMTLHSAKGLEFPLVFLSGMEENLFPHAMSREEPGRLEEERRLCYVGITRAMRRLVLSYAESRRLHGRETMNGMSRFVRDIPPQLMVEVRPRLHLSRPLGASNWAGSQRRQATGGFGESRSGRWTQESTSRDGPGFGRSPASLYRTDPARESDSGLRLGQRVRHAAFGEGVVIDFEGNGAQARVNVRFASAGTKWLLAALANLQPL